MHNRLLAALVLVPLGAGAALAAGAEPDLIVTQGGATLTLADVDAYMQRIPEDKRGGMMDSGKRIEQLLLSMLAQKQLAAEARKLGIDKDPQVGKEVELAVDEVLALKRMQKFRTEVKVPDFEALAKEKYQANKADYMQPGRVDVAHVLISGKVHGEAAAQTLANDVHAKAKADPKSFEALVEQYSDDPSKAANHGVIPNATTEKYAERFVEAAKELRTVGEVSEVIRTPFGYHVLKLVSREPDRVRTYDEVHEEIVRKLREDYLAKQQQDHIDQLRNNKLDVVSPQLVGALRTRYLPAGATLPDEASSAQPPATDKPAGK